MATSYSPRIVTDGLLFHFDAANPRSYPGTGTVWQDLSPNRFTASLLNGLTTVGSGNSRYMSFDGADDWARIDFPTPITLSTYTHDYWVFTNQAPGYRTMVDFGNDRNAVFINNYSILHFNPTIGANASMGFPGPWANITISHAFNQPFYFYLNGQLTSVSGNNGTVHTGVPSAGIGGGITGATTADELWNGRMGIIRFYLNKALTPEEVRQNYNATKGRYGLV